VGRERRRHDRLAKPFEGSWQGGSNAGACRISDLSLGGCFVQSLATPLKGQSTVVTINFSDHSLSFAGQVVYLEPGIGFAVQFNELDGEGREVFNRLLASMGSSGQAG
jgi:hypothetical protein